MYFVIHPMEWTNDERMAVDCPESWCIDLYNFNPNTSLLHCMYQISVKTNFYLDIVRVQKCITKWNFLIGLSSFLPSSLFAYKQKKSWWAGPCFWKYIMLCTMVSYLFYFRLKQLEAMWKLVSFVKCVKIHMFWKLY